MVVPARLGGDDDDSIDEHIVTLGVGVVYEAVLVGYIVGNVEIVADIQGVVVGGAVVGNYSIGYLVY